MAVTRKSSVLLELKGTFFHETEMLDLTKAQALPDTKYIISRLLTMMKDKCTMEEARIEVSKEIRFIWIFYQDFILFPFQFVISIFHIEVFCIDQFKLCLNKLGFQICAPMDGWKLQVGTES